MPVRELLMIICQGSPTVVDTAPHLALTNRLVWLWQRLDMARRIALPSVRAENMGPRHGKLRGGERWPSFVRDLR